MAKHATNLCGTEVGGGRWPYHAAHPGCWGKPWQGVVLALDDVRAWTGTLAFTGEPSQEKATAHVEWCLAQGLLGDVVPVLWHFAGEDKVYWESSASLVPYQEDCERWKDAREAALRADQERRAKRAG